MTVSSLATKRNISPNTSGWRGSPSKITIHHTAGVCSADALGWIFADPGRQASCNYGIGDDGEIICILEEEYHPWTSSNYANDHQAVTFEVSNSYAGGDWPIGSAAWDSMIRLAADICTRYGIEPYYDGTPNGTFTEHRMFAATGCPGEYIHARMNRIIQEVRAAMNGSTTGKWVQAEDGRWWYRYPDGSWPCSKWEKINDKWYFFDAEGWMAEGWLDYDGGRYYLKPKYGDMQTGWLSLGGEKYYFTDDGAMVTGFYKGKSGAWYCFAGDGALITDDSRITVRSNGKIKIA